MPPRPPDPLPPEVADRVRTYLAAFLPAPAVDDAVAEVAADSGFWGDTDETEILAVAHAVLTSRLRVATDVEVLVLNEDVGLPVERIAAVLAMQPAAVRRILDEALALLADTDVDDPVAGSVAPPADRVASVAAPADPAGQPVGAPVTPDASPRIRRRPRLAVVLAALLVVAVALAAAWVGAGADDCPATASICVTGSVLTDDVDPATGAPGPDRTSFAVGEPVTLWFSFSRRRAEAGPVEVRWSRDGAPLYATDVRLGSGETLNVSLAGAWSDEPGRYRVEVVEGEHVLLARDLRIGE